MYKNFLKRGVDFIVALLGLLLALPILLAVFVLLMIANDGKPFFFQQRPGKHGKLFRIIKFKTMNDRKDSAGNLLSDNERLTKVGSVVRKTSLDELPQLFNVLKGDMSLIGPRPLLPEYLELYSPFQSRRHELRPGITGWAQVNGRNTISWKQKFEYDVWYVDHCSLRTDLDIILKTVSKVLKGSDINASQEVPMERFKGE